MVIIFFGLGRPAFSIDSLLQRKVVSNHHYSDSSQNESKVEMENQMISSALVTKCSSRMTGEGALSLPSASNNPLESLTFENILKSAAMHQQKSKGKIIYAHQESYLQ